MTTSVIIFWFNIFILFIFIVCMSIRAPYFASVAPTAPKAKAAIPSHEWRWGRTWSLNKFRVMFFVSIPSFWSQSLEFNILNSRLTARRTKRQYWLSLNQLRQGGRRVLRDVVWSNELIFAARTATVEALFSTCFNFSSLFLSSCSWIFLFI